MRLEAKMRIVGFLSRDPELRYTRGGEAVMGLSVPYTPRRRDKATGEWVDAGDTLWVQASVWGDVAEALQDKLAKGTQVIVEGEPTLRAWESNGKSGVNLELKFAQVAIVPRLAWQGKPATATQGQQEGWTALTTDAFPPAGSFDADTPF